MCLYGCFSPEVLGAGYDEVGPPRETRRSCSFVPFHSLWLTDDERQVEGGSKTRRGAPLGAVGAWVGSCLMTDGWIERLAACLRFDGLAALWMVDG